MFSHSQSGSPPCFSRGTLATRNFTLPMTRTRQGTGRSTAAAHGEGRRVSAEGEPRGRRSVRAAHSRSNAMAP